MHCQAGQYAMKGNLYDKAVASLKEALRLNPYLWEAFEMLGALGESHSTSSVLSTILSTLVDASQAPSPTHQTCSLQNDHVQTRNLNTWHRARLG